MTFRRSSPRAGARWFVLLGVVISMTVLIGTAVLASHGLASLPGSNFEIDDSANLKLDHASPSVDWGSLAHATTTDPEQRRADAPTGQSDDSYKGGVKEDTSCPDEVTGSIPNNKSDLLTFHLYEEPGDPGFVNIAWSRVSDPSGTTLMDFEFNQSSTPCAQGPNVLRTAGDLLVEYAIDQGGSRAEISGRFWTGTAWGPSVDLDDGTGCGGGPCAVGTISQSVIPAADSDGLGEKQARTFGEAQIDLDLIFDEDSCTSFGSAMLKSRSSDAFTSQLKDFIRPIPIDLQNCGNVIIRKQTDPDGSTDLFGYTKDFDTDPVSDATFDLADDGVQDYEDTVLFGTGYTVTEDLLDLPAGWDFVNVDCSASTGVTPVIAGALVTFDIDADTDVLDCTYNNEARGTIIIEKETVTGAGSFDFTSTTLTPASWTLTTTEAGEDGVDSETFSDLVPGTYDADETVPDNWNLVSTDCDDDDSTVGAIVVDAGETVTCRFVNERETGAIEISKFRKHAADGAGDHPHSGVVFTISGGSLSSPVEVTTVDGVACYDGLLDGSYTVTETVPAGYVSDDEEQTVSVTAESTCGDGNEATVEFHNMPLTNITVSVDSQIDGGTASTISCVDAADVELGSDSTGENGDGSVTVDDLEPTAPGATLICTIVVDP